MKYLLGVLSAIATGGMAALGLLSVHAPMNTIALTFAVTAAKALGDVWQASPDSIQREAAAVAEEVAKVLAGQTAPEVKPNA